MNQASKHSTAVLRTACAIVFVLFTFSYLYFYQADLLAYTQHVFSKGRTHYDPTVGAVLLTLILSSLSFAIWKATKIDGATHWLIYFPSLLLLAMLTSAKPVTQQSLLFPSWLWIAPVLLVLFVGLVVMIKHQQPQSGQTANSFSHQWICAMSLALMFLLVGLLSNHNNVIHFRLRAEQAIMRGHPQEALLVGSKLLDTDESLTMLRIHALLLTRQLPEKLFTYPLKGGSTTMHPGQSGAQTLLMPTTSVTTQARRNAFDYQLCGALLDRDIDRFARLADANHLVGDTVKLPRHYAEALTLYTHLRSAPVIIYKNNVLETDYKDYQKLDRETPDPRARKNRLYDVFGNTYWYYYQYGK